MSGAITPLPNTPSSRGVQLRGKSTETDLPLPYITLSRDSSVGIALGYGLDDRGSTTRFPAGAGNFSSHYRVQNGSGAHTASYPMGNRYSFPAGKAAGA
jgi:hypothetical protein